MPRKADSPLQKITINLYESDVAALAEYHGYGWSEQVRQIVHTHVETHLTHKAKTLGDLT